MQRSDWTEVHLIAILGRNGFVYVASGVLHLPVTVAMRFNEKELVSLSRQPSERAAELGMKGPKKGDGRNFSRHVTEALSNMKGLPTNPLLVFSDFLYSLLSGSC